MPIFGNDSNVVSGDQQHDSPVLLCETEADVSEPAEVAEGHRTEAVDLVPTHPMVDGCGLLSRPGFDEWVEDGERGLSTQCAMWPAVVVVPTKDIKLPLQLGQRAGSGLLLEEAL